MCEDAGRSSADEGDGRPSTGEQAEQPDRSRVRESARDATAREWEVFVREGVDEPARHVGSVTAAAPEGARELASTLFGGDASGLWLCPATEVRRYSTHALGARAGRAGGNEGGEEAGGAADSSGRERDRPTTAADRGT